MRNLVRLAVVVAVLGMTCLRVNAQTIIDWTGLGANDLYNNTDNWAGNNEPGNVNESARFDLAGTFNVEMPGLADRTVSDLFVLDGTISFASSAILFVHTYTVDDDAFIDTDLTIENTNGGDFAMVVNSDLSVRSDGTLTVQDSTSVTTGNLFVGRSSGGDGTLIVDGFGSVLDVSNSTILGSTGSTGTLTFQNGSTFNDFGGTITLVSGSTVGSTGRMNVLSGSTVNTASIRVGSLSTSASAVQEATLTVNGTDSAITQSGASTLTVGDATNPNVASTVNVTGNGTLNTGTGITTIQNGGIVNVSDATFNANGPVVVDNGTLDISTVTTAAFNFPSGETVSASNDGFVELSLYVLNGGRTFDFNTGADLNVIDELDIGTVGGPGTLIADGTGTSVTLGGVLIDASRWYDADVTFRNNATGDLGVVHVGLLSGVGADPNTISNFTIETGADVTTDTLLVTGRNSTATLTVDGSSTQLLQTTGSLFTIGDSVTPTGVATVNIQNSGLISTGTSTNIIRSNATVNVGVVGSGTLNANGTMIIDGGTLHVGTGTFNLASGKTLSANDGSLVQFDGNYDIDNDTTFDIESGAKMNVAKLDVSDTSALNVSGGTVSSTEDLTVDQGTVMISGGGSMSGDDAFIGFVSGTIGSELTVQDPNSTWNSTGTVLVGLFGSGTLNVEFGATATSNFGVIGEDMFAVGDATVTGTGSSWQITNDLIVGNFGMGTLDIAAGGSVSADRAFIASSNFSLGVISVSGSGSSLQTTGALYVGGNNLSSEGTGTLNIDSGASATIGGETIIWADGEINLSGGTLNATTIDHTDGGTFNFTGGTLHVVTFDGDLTNQGGTLAPGTSPGTTDVTGNYDQQSGSLEIEIGGTGAGDFDVLDVTGTATLAGMLDIQLIDLGGGIYSPLAGDSFEILTAGTLSGIFSGGTSLPTLTGLLQWNVNYDTVGNRVLLEVSTPLSADFDGDGDVDNSDLGLWETAYASTDVGDANGDGLSDGLDFLIWQEQFGLGVAAPLAAVSTVPEPGAAGLFLLGCVGILKLRTRRAPCPRNPNLSVRLSS